VLSVPGKSLTVSRLQEADTKTKQYKIYAERQAHFVIGGFWRKNGGFSLFIRLIRLTVGADVLICLLQLGLFDKINVRAGNVEAVIVGWATDG